MGWMRRAALAIVLCAAPLLAAPAQANPDLAAPPGPARGAAASGAAPPHPARCWPCRCPSAADRRPARRARTPSCGRSPAASARSGCWWAFAPTATCRPWPAGCARSAPGPRPCARSGVLAATVPSGAALVRALGADRARGLPRARRRAEHRRRPLRHARPPARRLSSSPGGTTTSAPATRCSRRGGGSRRSVAVLDTGLDVNHPEFAGSGRIARTYDTHVGGQDVTDAVGHGTFVTGLIAAVDGNGVGTKGVAGNTQILAIRASANGSFTERDLLRGIDFTLRRGGDVLNLSLAGDGLGRQRRPRARHRLPQRRAAGGGLRQQGPGRQPDPVPGRLARRRGAATRASASRWRPRGPTAAWAPSPPTTSTSAWPRPAQAPATAVSASSPPCPPRSPTGTTSDSCPTVFSQGGRSLCLRRGHELRRPDRLGHRRAGVADRAPAGLRAGGRGDDPLGAPDARHGLERVHGHGDRRRRRRHGAGAHLRRDRPARQGKRATRRATASACACAGRATAPSGAANSPAGSATGCSCPATAAAPTPLVRSGRQRPIDLSIRLRGSRAHVFLALACDANGNCGRRRLGRVRP